MEEICISKRKYYQLNERIKAPELRVVTKDNGNLGVLKTGEALERARADGLDLVVIAEKTNPPVAKILDFKKFLYEERKKESKSKAKSKKSQLKELRFGPSIGAGDLANRIERSKEFIGDGNQVRVTVRLKGREKAHPEIGLEKVEYFKKELEDVARLEKEPIVKGNAIIAVFVKK